MLQPAARRAANAATALGGAASAAVADTLLRALLLRAAVGAAAVGVTLPALLRVAAGTADAEPALLLLLLMLRATAPATPAATPEPEHAAAEAAPGQACPAMLAASSATDGGIDLAQASMASNITSASL